MSAGSIIIDLLMRTATLETDSKRAAKALNQLKKEAKEVGAAISLAFAGVAASSVAMVKSSIDAMDEMSKMAQKTGTSVEALSALAYAGDLSDVSLQDLGSALVKLSKNMSDAAMGTGEAMKGFDALGISVKNADGSLKSSDAVLAEVANKFAGFKDGAEKTALAVNLFGKAGAQLIPLLNSGAAGLDELRAEAVRLGVVLDTETSKAAELFNDNLTRMAAGVRGVANVAAAEMLPTLNDVSQMFVSLAKDETAASVAAEIVKSSIGGLLNVFQAVAILGSDVGFVFLTIGRELGAMAAQANALGVSYTTVLKGPAAVAAALAKAAATGNSSFKQFNAISDAVKEDSMRARAELDKFQAKILGLGSGVGLDDEARRRQGRGPSPAGLGTAPRMTKSPEKGKDPDADFKSYLDNLQKQIQKTEDLTTVEKLLDDIRRGSLTVSAEQQKQLEGLAKIVDSEKELVELRKLSREASIAEGDAVLKANEEYQSLMKRLLDGGPAAQLEEQRRQMMLLAEAMEQGRISADQFNDAATGFLGLNKEIEKGKSLAEEFGLTFSSAFEDAIVSGKGFSDVLKGVFQDLLKIIVRTQITEPLGKSFTGALKGAGGGDLFGSIFSGIGSIFTGGIAGGSGFGTGSAFGNMDFGGFFANGGSPPVGKASVVGEDGAELFIPKTAGTIIPNGMLGGSKSINYSPTFNIDSRTDQAEVLKITERAVRAGNAQLLNQLETAGRI